ncbi:TPA: Cro/CI family transcriptional regulator [Salmonella enterica subsp. enterica serovar Birkenhead]
MNKSEVIQYFGGVCKTAEALGLTHPSVSVWPEIIPKVAALELEKITNGALKCDLSVYKNRPRRNKRRPDPETSPAGETDEKV